MVVWSDAQTNSAGLHTGFALSNTGERVQLYAADGATLIDEVVFGLQLVDRSIGRMQDGTGTWLLAVPTPAAANRAQSVGAPGSLRVNEWMARPSTGQDWIELSNTESLPVPLGGIIVTDQVEGTPSNRPIPQLSFLEANGFVQFFASDLAETDANHLDFRLSADGETLTLYGGDKMTILDRVVFGEQVTDQSQGRVPDGNDAIAAFAVGRASPGKANFAEIGGIVISEVLSHTDDPLEDAIELRNLTAVPRDISHWWLSDTAAQPRKYRIPAGTVVPALGFVVIYQNQFASGATGFSLDSAEGDEVILSTGDATGALTGERAFVEFGALMNGVSVGRYPTSAGVDFVPLSARTFGVDTPGSLEEFRKGTGLTNALPRLSPVAITEIQVDPEENSAARRSFIELHNPGAAVVPLYDPAFPTNTWRLRAGITFDFPVKDTLEADGFLLLVSFDPAQNLAALAEFRTFYGLPDSVRIVGPFKGRLSSQGELLTLLHPDEPEGADDPNAGYVPYELLEHIEYGIAAPWPQLEAGLSLQRLSPNAYGNEPTNWVAALPTPGRRAVTDSDGDGMPDAWEISHQLLPENADDASLDPDGDGASNWAEFRAGTNPRDAASVFRIALSSLDGGQLQLRFNAVLGASYRLEGTGLLPVREWTTITNFTSVPVTGPVGSIVPTSPGQAGFFRVVLINSP